MSSLDALVEIRFWARSGRARQLRERGGVSLRELAEAVGVEASTVGRWENGEAVPRAAAALRWLDALRAVETATSRTHIGDAQEVGRGDS